MKKRILVITSSLFGAGLLAAVTSLNGGQKTLAAEPPTDPTQAAHVAAGVMPPDAATGDPVLFHQLLQLQAKVAQLEAALTKIALPMSAAPAGAAMPRVPGATPAPSSAKGMGMGKMKSGAAMPGMGAGATPAPPMAGMSGGAAPAAGMMGMMDKMMGMMDKMMSMGGGGMPAGGGMGMIDMDDNMEMGRMGGPMPAGTPSSGMSSGGGMGMDKLGIAGMMGMGGMGSGAAAAMTQSALPGFPGASHLYHIGATGFFLDHPQHIALTIQQQAALNTAKEQASLAKSTADRAIEQAEQELWMLTAADQPDATQIQAKLAEIGKLRGDERLSFIRTVGDASKILTDEQRNILTGFAPPAPAATAPMAGGMKDM